MFSLAILQGYSIDMKVGDTRTLSITPPPYLSYCKWDISNPECIKITSTLYATSSSVEIKAVKATPPATHCVVQCTYNYKELDPVTGRYIYSRTEKEVWRILVEDSGSGGESGGGTGGGGTGSSKITLNTHLLTCEQDGWAGLLYPVAYNGPSIHWDYNDKFVFPMKAWDMDNTVEVKGLAIGTTNITCTNAYGGKDVCELTVLPKDHYEVGDEIKIADGNTVLPFVVLNNSSKTCCIDNVWTSEVNQFIFVPEKAVDYIVTEVGDFAFQNNEYIKNITLPETLRYIRRVAFSGCVNLEAVSLPSSLETIEECAFYGASKLKTVIFPQGLKKIENMAFYGTALESIYFENGLESIGHSAFKNVPCGELLLPSTLKSIESSAFNAKNEFSYSTITSQIMDPFAISDYVFNESTYQNAVLLVPASTKQLYETTPGWKNFIHIEEYGESDIDDVIVDSVEADSNIEVYNLNGIKVAQSTDNLRQGIYIVRNGSMVNKIEIR